MQFKIEVVCMVDPKTTLDPILLGRENREIIPKLVSKRSKLTGDNTRCTKRGTTKSSAGDSLLSIVREDVVREDQLRWDLADHPKHRVVLLILVRILLPQHLLELNLIKALGVLSCMDLS
jgi:hypothetical protein